MTSMIRFSSVSIADFEQVNVCWDVSEKPDLLPNNFEISRSFYHENNVPSRLSPQWLCDNSCTWAHDVHHVHVPPYIMCPSA